MRNSTLALASSGALFGGAAALTAYGLFVPSSQFFGPTIFRGPGLRRSIALTFDDGPSEQTSDLLEYLNRESIRATFFQCGMNVKRLPSIAGQVAAAGHQIGNHTYSHPRLPFHLPRTVQEEFSLAQEIITDATGVRPMILRAPYGARWFGMRQVQKRLSLLGVLWTVIGNDWVYPARRIVERVLSGISPGGIICLHDGRAVSTEVDVTEMLVALRRIVPVLKDAGYSFETVAEILN